MNKKLLFGIVVIVVGVLAFALLSNESVPKDDAGKVKLALSKLPKLRKESVGLLDESRKNNPEHFKILMAKTDERVEKFLASDIRPIDLSNVVGAKYSSYNRDIWRIVGVAHDLLSVGQAYSSSDSKYAGKPELVKKAAQGFEFILSLMRPEGGTCGAPDANIDRFTYGASWDAFSLIGTYLPKELQERFAKHLLKAAQFQLSTYGNPKWEKYGFSGKYPNMDAAYLLVLVQANKMFENGGKEGEFGKEIDPRTELLEKCIDGSTWMYITNWNATPGYTRVTLDWFGRAYQISKNPKMLKQIQVHADYYKYFLEPSGLMDNGMAPFIKHDWGFSPYGNCMDSMELVHRYAPTPVLQHQMDKLYKHINLHWAWHLFWVAPNLGKTEELPLNFVRNAPEHAGILARYSDRLGSITAYVKGREIAADTRVSAIVSSADAKVNHSIFAGAFIEVIQDGASYHIGDMKPEIKKEFAENTAAISITQKRHMMGPKAPPLIFGNHLDYVKYWKFDCWKGGSPATAPAETYEKWAWVDNRLSGEIKVTALEDVKLDGVRLSLPVAIARLSEKVVIPNGEARRYGSLCIALSSNEPNLEKEDSQNFDFAADVPEGEYTVTLVVGDPDYETFPFDVVANDQKVLASVATAKGVPVEKSFSVKVAKNEGLKLRFEPLTGDHWKIGALSIVSKDLKTYSKKFDVGKAGVPPMDGYVRLTGGEVYSKEKGYGWGRDLAVQERLRGKESSNLITDLISSSSTPSVWAVLEKGKSWKKGDSISFHVTVGMSDSLEAWLKK